VSVTQGCGCAPDDLVRWLVVALLEFAGAALVFARWWRRRRATPGSAGSGESLDGAAPTLRVRTSRSAPAVAGMVILGLGLVVALVPMGSDPALLILGLGATVGSAGFVLASSRTGRGTTTPTG
jgi:peptidoglycan/LPS O-acetylase OafA/YrhL